MRHTGYGKRSDRGIGTQQEKIAVALPRLIESSETFTRARFGTYYPRAVERSEERRDSQRKPSDRMLWAGVTGEQDG
jgi:hypothetical protein